MPFIETWLQIAKLINWIGAVEWDILKHDGDRFVVWFQRSILHTTVWGAAAEVVAVPWAVAGDVVVCTLATPWAVPRTIASAIVSDDDEVTITFSGDPDDDHVVNMIVSRP